MVFLYILWYNRKMHRCETNKTTERPHSNLDSQHELTTDELCGFLSELVETDNPPQGTLDADTTKWLYARVSWKAENILDSPQLFRDLACICRLYDYLQYMTPDKATDILRSLQEAAPCIPSTGFLNPYRNAIRDYCPSSDESLIAAVNALFDAPVTAAQEAENRRLLASKRADEMDEMREVNAELGKKQGEPNSAETPNQDRANTTPNALQLPGTLFRP